MRATKAQTRQRDDEVFKIILLGGEFHDLREHARENNWGLSEGQLRRYQQKALGICQELTEKDRPKLFARHVLQRRLMYARAMETGDLRTAHAILKDEAELLGLYPPGRGGVGVAAQVSAEVNITVAQQVAAREAAVFGSLEDFRRAAEFQAKQAQQIPFESGVNGDGHEETDA